MRGGPAVSRLVTEQGAIEGFGQGMSSECSSREILFAAVPGRDEVSSGDGKPGHRAHV